MASTDGQQHHFLPHLPSFHHTPVMATTTTVGTTPAQTTTTTATTTAAAPEAAPSSPPPAAGAAAGAANTHHYVSLSHLSELLHSISVPHAHLPHPNLNLLHPPAPTAHPAFDLAETYGAFVVTADLAGLGPDDVVVEANDHFCTLTISGTIPRPDPLAAVAAAHDRDEHDHHGHDHHRPGEAEGESPVSIEHKEPTPAPAEAAGHKADEQPAAGTAKQAVLHWHVSERRPGQFHRQFRLPSLGEVDMAGCRASMHHGLLTVVVPKRAELPPKTEEELAHARRLRIVAASFTALTPGMPIF